MLTTGGPELPLGRSARSTRKTKPSSVVSAIRVLSLRATKAKYSCTETWPETRPVTSVTPVVWPSSSYT